MAIMPTIASASTVTLSLSGTVSNSVGAISNVVQGDPVSVTLTYDTALFTYAGQYSSPLTSKWLPSSPDAATLSFQVGSLQFIANDPGVIVIPGQLSLYFAPTSPPGPAICNSSPYSGCAALFLYGLSSDPTKLPSSLAGVGSGSPGIAQDFFDFSGIVPTDGFDTLNLVPISATPIPTTWLLLLTGLMGIFLASRRAPGCARRVA